MTKASIAAPGDAARRLSAFIEKAGISFAKAADALETVHPALLAWLSGACRPNAYRRALIEAWTAGAVPAVLWLSEAERSHLRKIRPFKRAA